MLLLLFGCITLFILFNELSPLDADDSLERSDTVSLNAESLSGLSVREDSLNSVDVAVDCEIVELAPDTMELERLWPWGLDCLKSPFCSNKLSSFKIESNSDSCVSSKLAIENL